MKLKNETKIGIFVIGCAVLLAAMTWKAGNFNFSPRGYALKVLFKDIDGVNLNAPVTLNGLEVGRVQAIRILYGEATRVELTLWLKESAQIHKGAKAYVKNMGFMGEKLVALTTGDDGTEFLPRGTALQGEEPADFQKILAEGQKVAVNLNDITRQVDTLLRDNSKAIDDSIKNFASLTGNINERLQLNKDHIDDMMASLGAAGKNLEDLSCDLKANPWKLLYRPRRGECPAVK